VSQPEGHSFSCAADSRLEEALPLCRRLEQSPEGEATDFIAFAFVSVFLFVFSAQKSHVKPQNHLTPSNKRKSSLKFSYPQTAILKIVEKKQSKPRRDINPLRG
jgi:hypothetical protein